MQNEFRFLPFERQLGLEVWRATTAVHTSDFPVKKEDWHALGFAMLIWDDAGVARRKKCILFVLPKELSRRRAFGRRPGDVYICGECIELCQSILDQERPPPRQQQAAFHTDPIAARDRRPFGRLRDRPGSREEVLAVAVHSHYKRLTLGAEGSDIEVDKSNILCSGRPARAKRSWHAPWPRF